MHYDVHPPPLIHAAHGDMEATLSLNEADLAPEALYTLPDEREHVA